MGRRNYTGLFFNDPSFWEGFARVLDVGGTFDSFDEHVSTPEDAFLAMAADWYAVGADLHHAIKGEATRLHDLDENSSRFGPASDQAPIDSTSNGR